MKSITLLLNILFTTSIVLAQYGPPRPSIDATFKKVKETGGIYKGLENKYGMSNPKSTCKLEKKYYTTNAYGKIYEDSKYTAPEWHFRKSKLTKKQESLLHTKLDYDICYVTFTFKTPKNKEGVSYEIPVSAWYVRRQNTVLTNEWHYDGAVLDAPYKVVGKSHKIEFYSLVDDMIKKTEAAEDPADIDLIGITAKLKGMYRFKSLVEGPEMDEAKKYSNLESITRWYYVTGDFLIYEGSGYDSIKAHYQNRTIGLKIKFSKKLKFDTQSEGTWKLDAFEYGSGRPMEGLEGEKSDDHSLRGTYERFGFNYINKEQPTLPLPYFSKKAAAIWANEISSILVRLSEGDLSAYEELKKHCTTDEIADKYKTMFYDEIHLKLCYTYTSRPALVSQTISRNDKKTQAFFNFYIKREYCKGDDKKECLKKYKAAGMSKTLLKGGSIQKLNENIYAEVKLVLKDNTYLLSQAPVLNTPLKF